MTDQGNPAASQARRQGSVGWFARKLAQPVTSQARRRRPRRLVPRRRGSVGWFARKLAHPRGRWLTLAVVTVAAVIDTLDASIVTVVLPVIQRDLGASAAVAQWALAGYALAFALFLITGGRLGDIFGHKRVFMVGVAGFTVSSLICGAAPWPELLVAGRFAQGAMAALMVPQVVSVVVTLFKQDEWPGAFAMVGGAMSVGAVAGPLLGGLLTELDISGTGWRAIFFINLPIGILTLILAGYLMPETRSEKPPRVDIPGVLLLTLASLGLLYPLVQGREHGWPPVLFLAMAASVPLLVLFAIHQRRRHARDGSALVPPTLFTHRSFSVGLIMTLLTFTGVGSYFLVLTYHLQFGLGWSPFHTALVTAAWPIGIATTFQIAWRRGHARGRLFVAAGVLTMAAGTLITILVIHSAGAALSWPQVAFANLTLGLGMGLCSPILTAVVLSEVPAQDAGAGSGVVNAVIQFGSAAGIAIVGVIFFNLSAVRDASTATTTTLWYNVGVFLLTALLIRLMPDQRQSPPMRTEDAHAGTSSRSTP